MRDVEDGVRIMTSGFGRVNEVELMRAQTEQRNIKKRRGRNKLKIGLAWANTRGSLNSPS